MNGWPHHPAADLFPMLSAEELDELAEDIREHGLREPIWLYDEAGPETVLLDGRNRLAACEKVGVEPTSRMYTGSDPIGFSISANVRRRHLTGGQRAAVGSATEELYAAEAQRRKAQAPGQPRGTKQSVSADLREETTDDVVQPEPARKRKSSERAAKVAGTSGRAVEQFNRVAKQAPELAEKVKAGTLALDRAERIVRDKDAERRKVEQARAEAAAAPITLTVDIRHGDFRQVLTDVENVDAIITDPPYPAEYLDLLDDLAAWADKVLAPEGVLAVLMGQTHLPEVYRRLDGHRPYRWTACYLTGGGGYVSHARRVQSNWKPLIVYGGGPRFGDVFRSEGTDANAKTLHRWGQDYTAFHSIIERLTAPGQTVVDPFAGSGTTLLAAHALGRHAVGCDLDADAVATARERVA